MFFQCGYLTISPVLYSHIKIKGCLSYIYFIVSPIILLHFCHHHYQTVKELDHLLSHFFLSCLIGPSVAVIGFLFKNDLYFIISLRSMSLSVLSRE
jgi:hypothetical protein